MQGVNGWLKVFCKGASRTSTDKELLAVGIAAWVGREAHSLSRFDIMADVHCIEDDLNEFEVRCMLCEYRGCGSVGLVSPRPQCPLEKYRGCPCDKLRMIDTIPQEDRPPWSAWVGNGSRPNNAGPMLEGLKGAYLASGGTEEELKALLEELERKAIEESSRAE